MAHLQLHAQGRIHFERGDSQRTLIWTDTWLKRDGKPTQMTFEAFAERVGKPGTTKIEERIHDPLVRIDNDLAVVWAQFDFLVDGKVDHCGTDLFNLVRVEGTWMIASVADTGTKTCSQK